jgi:hypothetical protein
MVGGARFTTSLAAVAAAVGVQLALGYPFLAAYPSQYVGKVGLCTSCMQMSHSA